jgi:hypothetical protein
MRKNEIFRAIEETGYPPIIYNPTFKKLVETLQPEVVRIKHGVYGLIWTEEGLKVSPFLCKKKRNLTTSRWGTKGILNKKKLSKD